MGAVEGGRSGGGGEGEGGGEEEVRRREEVRREDETRDEGRECHNKNGGQGDLVISFCVWVCM